MVDTQPPIPGSSGSCCEKDSLLQPYAQAAGHQRGRGRPRSQGVVRRELQNNNNTHQHSSLLFIISTCRHVQRASVIKHRSPQSCFTALSSISAGLSSISEIQSCICEPPTSLFLFLILCKALSPTWKCRERPVSGPAPDTQPHVPVPRAISQIAQHGSSSPSAGFLSPTPVALPPLSCADRADRRVCSHRARRNRNRSVRKPRPFSPSTSNGQTASAAVSRVP